jgi:hypothetical protein
LSHRLDQRSHDANEAGSALGHDDFLGIAFKLRR